MIFKNSAISTQKSFIHLEFLNLFHFKKKSVYLHKGMNIPVFKQRFLY